MKRQGSYRTAMVRLACIMGVLANAGQARADIVFGEPENLGPPINTSGSEWGGYISADGLSFYFVSGPGVRGGFGRGDLWVSKRESLGDPWKEPVNLGPTINTEHREGSPRISIDGLQLFFSSERPDGYGAMDIWVATRDTEEDDWRDPVNLGPLVNGPSDEMHPSISADGLELYFSGWRPDFARPGGVDWCDIWVSTRATKDDAWGEPVNLGPVVNSDTQDARPCLSLDGLSLFFDSQRHGRLGDGDLYVSRRATLNDPWGTPVHLGPIVNSLVFDEAPSISADGSTLFFDSFRESASGKLDIWQVSIVPILDFNADGLVDVLDTLVMVENWGVVMGRGGPETTLCDIAPLPFGDGIVDAKDLLALAEHMIEGTESVNDQGDVQ
jgi:WD40-like Beta Propeller Repeat